MGTVVRWTSAGAEAGGGAGGDGRLGLALGLTTVIVALGLRVWQIADYTVFQGDQGVDALAARRVLVEHAFLLEGPATSVGGVHLGPVYYYLLALPMLVDWLNPLADAVLMALLGAAAVGIVFVLARRWFGPWPAFAAAGLFAISPAAIVASRSAWNPAPAPLFVCLAVLGLDSAWRSGRPGRRRTSAGTSAGTGVGTSAGTGGGTSAGTGADIGADTGASAGAGTGAGTGVGTGEGTRPGRGLSGWLHSGGWWLLLVGLALGVTIQLHYFALPIVVVCVGFVMALAYSRRNLAVWALGAVLIAAALLSPLVIHEFLTGFPNARALTALLGGELSAGTGGLANAPPPISAPRRAYEVFSIGLVGIFLAGNIEVVAAALSAVIVAAVSVAIVHQKELRWPIGVVACLLAATVAAAVVYRGPIFEHYFVAISPVLFLALAAAFALEVRPKSRTSSNRLGLGPRPKTASTAYARVTAAFLGKVNLPMQICIRVGTAALAALNLVNSPLRDPPLYQLAHTQTVAAMIADRMQQGPTSQGQQAFELWLVAGGEADGAYRFWLTRMGTPPLPQDTQTPGPQLFIICRRSVCELAGAQAQALREWSPASVAWQTTVGDDEILLLVR